MNNEILIGQMRELCISPGPERKGEFFQRVREQELMNRRPAAVSHGRFLAGQLFFIEKWIWVLSGMSLLLIVWVCRRNTGNYPFALTPLLAAGILLETGRSRRWKMTELEQAARFSARSVMLARVFLVGAVNTSGLLIIIPAVRPYFSYSVIRVFLYMMVPYLTAALSGSVYERRHRTDQGWGSILICILSSAFFASAPLFFRQLYEESRTVFWGAAFILAVCGLAVCTREYISEREEPVWN